MTKDEKKIIAENTLQILKQGSYYNQYQKNVSLEPALSLAIENSSLWAEAEDASLAKRKDVFLQQAPKYKTTFEVKNQSTLSACRSLVNSQQQVFCLNFASAKNAGGGFLNGAEAQEESIARASALYACQTKYQKNFYQYHLQTDLYYSHRMIYSPSVPVFRGEQGELLDEYYNVSFLTSPAVNIGALQQHNKLDKAKAHQVMLARTEKVLTIAAIKGYKTLVLGAWGCGVFKQDAKDVAGYFAKYLLNEGLFSNVFEHIVFAILSKDQKNIQPFYQVFGT